MIRKLMASSALALLMSAGGYNASQAQDAAPSQPAIVDDMSATQVTPSEDTLQPEQPTLATAFMGRTVYSSDAPDSENIGEVNDLIISDDGSITHAVVGVGGFLGIGEKDVAVPFDELQVVEREGDVSLIYAATREQLEAAPALDRTAYDPAQRFISEQAATDTATAPAAETIAPADQTPVAPADPMAPADQTAMAPADPMAPATTPDQTAMSADNAAPAELDADAAMPPADLRFVAFDAEQWRASDLMGQSVYGPDDTAIGSVSDLVLQQDGGARSALIDVGGFLGIGAKTVAIPISELTVTPLTNTTGDTTLPADSVTTLPADQMAVDGAAAPAEQVTADGAVTLPPDQMAADGGAAAPADLTAAAPVEQQMAADGTARETEGEALASGNVRVTVAMTKEQLEALPEFTTPAETAAATTAPETMTTEQTAVTDTTAPAEPLTTGSTRGDFTTATQELTARELTGATVYAPDDTSVGEIGDLVLNKAGDIEAAIVDVGGFLGMGEKPVGLALSDLQVRRDENGTLLVRINATKDQLTNAPTYEVVAQ